MTDDLGVPQGLCQDQIKSYLHNTTFRFQEFKKNLNQFTDTSTRRDTDFEDFIE